MIKKLGGPMLLLAFIAGSLLLAYHNLKNYDDFFKTPFSTIVSILIAVIVSYYFVQKKNDERRKKEKNDQLLYKIQKIILSEEFSTVRESNLILHRSLANKISYLEQQGEKELKDDIMKLKEKFEQYREFYGDHYKDEEYMRKSEKEIKNYVTLMDDLCDKMHITLM